MEKNISIWQLILTASVVAAVITTLGGIVQQVFIVGPQQTKLQETIAEQQIKLQETIAQQQLRILEETAPKLDSLVKSLCRSN